MPPIFNRRTWLVLLLTLGCTWQLPVQAESDSYPARVLRVYVPASPGGSTDAIARVFAQYFEQATGTPVAIVNQIGGGGIIASHSVARSRNPNGGTLLLYHTALHVSHALGRSPIKHTDLKPLATLSMVNDVYAVQADAPYTTLQELLAYTRSNPGRLTVGSQFGATTQVKAQALTQLAPEGFRVVDSGSESGRITALLGGQVDVISISVASALQFEKNGDIRVLGVLNKHPDPFAPHWPTAVAQEVPANLPQVFTLYGPKAMPDKLVRRFDAIMANIAEDPEYQAAIKRIRQSPEYRDSAQAAAFMDEEYTQIDTIVKSQQP
jgi:tripartite-type tricarboxylate transporter receptor subunit TctC